MEKHSVYGQWLGWMMAAIYMGGRIPQIWLNVSTLLHTFLAQLAIYIQNQQSSIQFVLCWYLILAESLFCCSFTARLLFFYW